MTKVSIVGVEGSGKTVLMAVLGDAYKRPDKNGLSLKPNNFTTFKFVESAMADLRSGLWPTATPHDQLSQISWTLQRTKNRSVETVCELPMLDFAGEIYRLAFGDHTEGEILPYKTEVEALRNHVATSSCLVVLVNLSHVINGSMKDSRTLETIWLTQRIIEFAKERGVAKMALALSQVDRYRAVIESCGGVRATVDKYLPNIVTSYGEVPIIEVSAVDSVRPGPDGKSLPVSNFSSLGLAELIGCVWGKDVNVQFDNLVQRLLFDHVLDVRFWLWVPIVWHLFWNIAYGPDTGTFEHVTSSFTLPLVVIVIQLLAFGGAGGLTRFPKAIAKTYVRYIAVYLITYVVGCVGLLFGVSRQGCLVCSFLIPLVLDALYMLVMLFVRWRGWDTERFLCEDRLTRRLARRRCLGCTAFVGIIWIVFLLIEGLS